jgi:hypothetical protein
MNIFLMSILGLVVAGGVAAVVAGAAEAEGVDAAGVDVAADAGWTTGVLDEIEALPLTWEGGVAAGTDPKERTPSDFRAGAAAGDEDIGAETSSIDPKVTAEPCFTAPTLLLLTETPSLIGIPWPRVLGRRECVGCEGVVGTGD